MTDRLDDSDVKGHSASRVESERLDPLVTKALGLLAARRLPAAGPFAQHFSAALAKAVVSDNTSDARKVMAAMRESRVSVSEIIDHYIPSAARLLGMDWLEDRRSFTEVTIGSARLLTILRDLAEEDAPEPLGTGEVRGVVVVVPPDETHTLGAMVLAQQLRRFGVSVQTIVGQDEAEIIDALESEHHDAILISLPRREVLANAARLVERIRSSVFPGVPIVVGGAGVDDAESTKALTGADHVGTDAGDALRKCGLKASTIGANLRHKPTERKMVNQFRERT